MSATGSFLVKTANKAKATTLASFVPRDLSSKEHRYQLTVTLATELSKEDKDACWNLFVCNMKAFYESSQIGWDPESKQKELFHRLSRFILVRGADDGMVAYVMFRFEYEDANLVYCYELQVSPDYKRQGLGRSLMDLLKKIGKKYAMDKVMLTVFKDNAQAVDFYTHYGFSSDISCPGYEQDDTSVDYRILSLEI